MAISIRPELLEEALEGSLNRQLLNARNHQTSYSNPELPENYRHQVMSNILMKYLICYMVPEKLGIEQCRDTPNTKNSLFRVMFGKRDFKFKI